MDDFFMDDFFKVAPFVLAHRRFRSKDNWSTVPPDPRTGLMDDKI
jgi:hypothetical protein